MSIGTFLTRVELGTHETTKELVTSIRETVVLSGSYVDAMLGRIPLRKVISHINLFEATTEMLIGEFRNATFAEICTQIERHGGQLCPEEAAPQFCRQFVGTEDFSLHFASNPMLVWERHSCKNLAHLFQVEQSSHEFTTRYLDSTQTTDDGNDHQFGPGYRWVFTVATKT